VVSPPVKRIPTPRIDMGNVAILSARTPTAIIRTVRKSTSNLLFIIYLLKYFNHPFIARIQSPEKWTKASESILFL
jgi:hypothetical protein